MLVSHLTHLIGFRWTGQILTRELVEDWASSPGPVKPCTRATRLHPMGVLGRFIAQTRPHSFIPGLVWGRRQTTGSMIKG